MVGGGATVILPVTITHDHAYASESTSIRAARHLRVVPLARTPHLLKKLDNSHAGACAPACLLVFRRRFSMRIFKPVAALLALATLPAIAPAADDVRLHCARNCRH